jgi:transcription termination factor Rho
MDDVIFEEFKGTGNMELRLDRAWPSVEYTRPSTSTSSSTRHEELLYDRTHLNTIWKLRRVLHGLSADGNPSAALELLIDRIRSFPTNEMFLAEIAKAPSGV